MFFFSKQKGASMKLSETFGPKQNQNGRISSYPFCLKDHPMYFTLWYVYQAILLVYKGWVWARDFMTKTAGSLLHLKSGESKNMEGNRTLKMA